MLQGSLRRHKAVFVAIVLGAAAWATPAFAQSKKVSIEWKEIKGAAHYEIEIERDGKRTVNHTLDDTSWSGRLPFGIYTYQIRAVDRADRPGIWSTAKPLVVMPAPPEAVSPQGDKFRSYAPQASVTLKWNPVPGATEYQVSVTRADSKNSSVRDQSVKAHGLLPEVQINALAPGDYSWQVTAVFEARGREQAEVGDRKWTSQPSDAASFHVIQDELSSPTIQGPRGNVTPASSGMVNLRWRSVAGAEGYEVSVSSAADDGRVPAGTADKMSEKIFTVKSNSLRIPLPNGKYRWSVRALAAIATVDGKDVPGALSPVSETDFNLDPNAAFFEGSGYLALSTMLAPYSYQIATPFGSGSTASQASTFRASGEYWFKSQWGLALGFDHTLFEINSQQYSRDDVQADLKYRLRISHSKYGWFISSKLGFLQRGSIFVTQQDNFNGSAIVAQTQSFGLNTWGPVAGFDVRKQFTDKLSLGMKFEYYLPVAVNGGASLVSFGANTRNLGLGIQGLYWLSSHWGAGAGIYIEDRSIAAQPSGAPGPYTLTMDGQYFFGSLIYTWGR